MQPSCLTLTAKATPFKAIAPRWRELWGELPEPYPSLSPDWYEVWQARFPDENAAIWTVENQDGEVMLIAPLTVSDGEARFPYNDDLVDYADFVAPRGRVAPAALAALLTELSDSAAATRLTLKSIPDDSATVKALTDGGGGRDWRVSVETEDPAPYKILSTAWDDYLLTLRRKDRHELKRKLKRIAAAGDVALRILTDADEIAANLGDFFELHRLSSSAKKEFMTPARQGFFSAVIARFARLGMARLNFLELDGERVATSVSFVSGGVNYLYNSGYNPQFRELSAGLINHALSIRALIKDGVSKMDFMRGDEQYKYHLGATDRRILTVNIVRA